MLDLSRMMSVDSHVRYRYMRTPEKEWRLRELNSQHHNTDKQLQQVQHRLSLAIQEEGISIDECMHGDLRQIMEECADKVTSEHPVGSSVRMFWEQQLKAESCTNQCQMGWHPLIVKWWLYLRHQSSSAYEAMKGSLWLNRTETRPGLQFTGIALIFAARHRCNYCISFYSKVFRE